MADQNAPTENLAISDTDSDSHLGQELAETISRVSRDGVRVVVKRNDAPLAALVSVGDPRRLEQLDREWDNRTKAIERFSEAIADVPTAEAEAEVARTIAERRRLRSEEAERRSA